MSSRPERPRATLKTYSHLAGARRMPTEYELVTSQLLYYPARGGFEVATPIGDWYARYQRGSPLASADWEKFHDPRATTYTSYTALQKTREAYVDGIFASIEASDYDASLSRAWTATLARTLFPLRYPWHGLQMAAAYVGQMAPSGRITIAALLQTADEMRRIQRVAYRMALFARANGGERHDEADAMHLWMREPAWQPLRETIERMLVTYDWGEAFVALNLCVKPALDEALRAFGQVAKRAGDYLLAELLRSFEEDAEWQRSWTRALARMLADERPENADAMRTWASTWTPRALEAASSLVASFDAGDAGDAGDTPRAARAAIVARLRELALASLGDDSAESAEPMTAPDEEART
jgi:toluene monooxygenase system protein E